jgi:hypothetical protein
MVASGHTPRTLLGAVSMACVSAACLALAVTTMAGSGCLRPRSEICSDGRTCPPNSRCDVQYHRCVSPDDAAAAACAGLGEESSCVLAGADGRCLAGSCQPYFCGDGVITGLESCDRAPPPGKTCLDYGFDRGLLGCSPICGLALEDCGDLGWTSVWSGDDVSVNDIWGSGPDDVFAVGSGDILHWDGATWSSMATKGAPPHRNVWGDAVWGNGVNDVYAVAVGTDRGPAIRHWDGESWGWMPFPARPAGFRDVWGSGPDDIYFVGDRIVHWNGTSMSEEEVGTHAGFSVWGSGRDDVFVVTQAGELGEPAILHWDERGWSQTPPGSINALDPTRARIWGSGPRDVFAVGGNGTILHSNGTAWSAMQSGTTAYLGGVWGTGASDVIVSAGDGVLHWDGVAWSLIASPPALNLSGSVWGSGPGDVYAVANAGSAIAHWDGTTWSTTTEQALGGVIRGVWVYAENDAFAVGNENDNAHGAVTLHWDGRRWSRLPSDIVTPALRGVWGSSPRDVFAVGDAGTIVHWDGGAWISMESGTTETLIGVWGSGDEVFAVGYAGTVVRWNRLRPRWSLMESGITADLLSIWGTGLNDVFVGGESGTMLHWESTHWRVMESGTAANLYAIWGTGPANVLAVGFGGTIVHWDGTRWSAMESNTRQYLFAVGGSGAGDVWAAGLDVLLHKRGSVWEPVAHPMMEYPLLDALWVTPAHVMALGFGTIQLDRRAVTCIGPERYCRDGWDNDCDGLQDGADPDCAGMVAERCANLDDDDYDGLTDCADPDCATSPACRQTGTR